MNMTKAFHGLLICFGLALPIGVVLADPSPEVSLLYQGSLVAEPCTLLPEDENLRLDFGTLVDKYLYLNGRTHGALLQLHLVDCDVSLGTTLKVTFSGAENAFLPGLLALSAGSEASGIAIGMETPQGLPLPLNQAGAKYPLQDGSTVISILAYVQGEPEAIAQKTIGRGPFSAVATFNLEYE
ncbi:Major MR/P fimbria protein precursor [Serratia entomophila]|jgi:type 1 fimbria pilin|uniref:Fimbrial protein n=1 Tax=Serratia entomophila TaxID=42906 RepID=A0ABY5CMM8_9GAMM|nr:fimbrial protein [Serratia entomophila]UIW16814.1 fimbrial protein [Serratia entomophila]USU99370.1 fimbrial protein [Serratia entomophila]CAI0716302.1 Major MR/P fimbria protein precursor [Serratia entomophila]CAI0718290.1 Major MR/P fimbria protein precursor [Serratia entomophila]CAI0719724.1 Major MR/P fimbria protein precursor [Serratia entomophila]